MIADLAAARPAHLKRRRDEGSEAEVAWRYKANRFSYNGTRVVSRISLRIASLCSDFFCVET
jgi:hypothetical protein